MDYPILMQSSIEKEETKSSAMYVACFGVVLWVAVEGRKRNFDNFNLISFTIRFFSYSVRV